jgi:hypothetical protein
MTDREHPGRRSGKATGTNGGSTERAAASPARGSTLVLTNLTKLVGVAVFVNEAVFRAQRSDAVLAVCALLVLGAQVAENVLLSLIDKLLGDRSDLEGK